MEVTIWEGGKQKKCFTSAVSHQLIYIFTKAVDVRGLLAPDDGDDSWAQLLDDSCHDVVLVWQLLQLLLLGSIL
jgi:hypothetical protein